MTLETVQKNAARFQTRIKWRNLREYIAGAIVVGAFGYFAAIAPGWILKSGCALIALAGLNIVYQLHWRGSSRVLPAEGLAAPDFHRRELVRQQDMARSVWWWGLAPMIPGLGLYFAGMWQLPASAKVSVATRHYSLVQMIVIFGLLFAVIVLANQLATHRLQKKIDELDRFSLE